MPIEIDEAVRRIIEGCPTYRVAKVPCAACAAAAKRVAVEPSRS